MADEQELAFRRAMGAYATGVTIVSAAAPGGGPVSGLTVNSLTSLSLSPRLLLWCLDENCARYGLFAAADTWGVTVLGADEEGLARRFAAGERARIEPAEIEDFAGAPVLRAGVAHYACRTHVTHKVGDHLIIVGAAVDFRAGPGAGLTFFRGRYGRAEEGST